MEVFTLPHLFLTDSSWTLCTLQGHYRDSLQILGGVIWQETPAIFDLDSTWSPWEIHEESRYAAGSPCTRTLQDMTWTPGPFPIVAGCYSIYGQYSVFGFVCDTFHTFCILSIVGQHCHIYVMFTICLTIFVTHFILRHLLHIVCNFNFLLFTLSCFANILTRPYMEIQGHYSLPLF